MTWITLTADSILELYACGELCLAVLPGMTKNDILESVRVIFGSELLHIGLQAMQIHKGSSKTYCFWFYGGMLLFTVNFKLQSRINSWNAAMSTRLTYSLAIQ